MKKNNKHNLGILAFGSLIDNPGREISEIEVDRIVCETPFNIEFGRTSVTRGNAPTLIPVKIGGQKVKAIIILLNPETHINTAKSILWRRELHKTNQIEEYVHSEEPNTNKVVVKELTNFMNVNTVDKPH